MSQGITPPAAISTPSLSGDQTWTGQQTWNGTTNLANTRMAGPDPWLDITHPKFAGGAKGDGVTDDTAAILAAFAAAPAAGATIFMPPLSFIYSGYLQVPANCTLAGAGKYATTLRMKNGANLTFNLESNGVGVTFRDFTMDGNKANQTSGVASGISLVNDKGTIINCRAINMTGLGLQATAANDCAISFSDSESCAGVGINIGSNTTRTRIIGNRIESAGGHGFLVGGGGNSNVVVQGNIVRNPGQIGIALGSGTSFAQVVGNIVTLSTVNQNAVDTGSATDVVVDGNVITGGSIGINPDTGSRVIISNNRINNSATQGIGLFNTGGTAAGRDFTVTGNLIVGAGDHGIMMDCTRFGVVANNVVKNSGRLVAGRSGIAVTNNNSLAPNEWTIVNNHCYDDQVTQTQAYGLLIDSTATNIRVSGNNFRNNLSGTISDLSTVARLPGDLFRDSSVLYDDFKRADGALGVALSGQSWSRSGAPLPSIVSNRMVAASAGVSYAMLDNGVTPYQIGASFVWTAGSTFPVLAIICSIDAAFGLQNMVHFIQSSQGWALQVRVAGGAFVSIGNGTFAVPLTADGATEYRSSMTLVGTTAYVALPDGTRAIITDSRIGTMAGPRCIWEPTWNANGTDQQPQFTSAWTVNRGKTPPAPYWGIEDGLLDSKSAQTISGAKTFSLPVLGTAGVTTKTKAGTPGDGDFATTPADGTMVADTTANKIWVRVGGVWKGATLA